MRGRSIGPRRPAPNATNDVMPEDGSISDPERTKLGEWLACGAP
jgi:hypothetical protein